MKNAFLVILIFLFGVANLFASGEIYTTLDYPGATSTSATGISQGIVVGYYFNAGSSLAHGFIYDGNNYSAVDYPGSISTRILGIDGSRMVGRYDTASGRHGFVYDGSVFTTIDDPLTSPLYSNGSEAWGISANKIVGYFIDDNARTHGYVFNGTSFTTLDYPLAAVTFATGIEANKIVGSYIKPGGAEHGYIYDGTTYTTFDHPLGTKTTELFHISGERIVGWYSDVASPNLQRGFLFDGSSFIPINVPLAKQTVPVGIERDVLVGEFIDQGGKQHGFVRAIPEPSTLFLLGIGAISLLGYRRG